MKRPAGITLLCIAMTWVSIPAFVNAWTLITTQEHSIPVYFAPLMVAYGIAALVTTVGLWTMSGWALGALKIWMAICGAFILGLAIFSKLILVGGVLGLLGFLIFVSVLFGFLHGYVENALAKDN